MSFRAEKQKNKKDSLKQRSSQQTTQNFGPSAHQTHPVAIIQRAQLDPRLLTPEDVLHLQSTIGNRVVGRLLTQATENANHTNLRPVTQSKPVESAFGMLVQRQEGLEEEIQMKAEQAKVQRQEIEEEESLQGKFTTSETPAHRQGNEGETENRNDMPDPLRTGLEALSGMDLSGVRVHYNASKPAKLNALAYTQGQDIHIGPGQVKHLPHEGWHIVQQMQARVKPTIQAKGVSINTDAGLEREADQMGSKAARYNQARESGTKPLSTVLPSENSAVQRKLKIMGLTNANQKDFIKKMNKASKLKFELNASGFVQQKDASIKATDEYSKQIVAAIKNAQTVKLNLVKHDAQVFIDSFAIGDVDYSDMMGLSDKLFQNWLIHFVVERFAIANYETKKATASSTDFSKAHKLGHKAQERQMKEWYPKKNIRLVPK